MDSARKTSTSGSPPGFAIRLQFASPLLPLVLQSVDADRPTLVVVALALLARVPVVALGLHHLLSTGLARPGLPICIWADICGGIYARCGGDRRRRCSRHISRDGRKDDVTGERQRGGGGLVRGLGDAGEKEMSIKRPAGGGHESG